MAYTDVISVANAKSYLGIDGTAHDTTITRLIGVACKFVETHSQHIFEAQDKEYIYIDFETRVYDYPLNSTANTTATATEFEGYTLYEESNTETDSIVVNVGYSLVSDIPAELIEAAYQMIYSLFHGKSVSNATMQLIAIHKRWII